VVDLVGDDGETWVEQGEEVEKRGDMQVMFTKGRCGFSLYI
jgi:cob(I)alamin adenosyltransferase